MQLQAKLTMNIIGSAETLITITTLLLIVGHSVCLKLICTWAQVILHVKTLLQKVLC